MRTMTKRDPKVCELCGRTLPTALTAPGNGNLVMTLPCPVCRPQNKRADSDCSRGSEQKIASDRYAEKRDRENKRWSVQRWYT